MELAVKLGKLIKSFSLLRRKFGLVWLAQGTQALKTEHIKMTCSSLLTDFTVHRQRATMMHKLGYEWGWKSYQLRMVINSALGSHSWDLI